MQHAVHIQPVTDVPLDTEKHAVHVQPVASLPLDTEQHAVHIQHVTDVPLDTEQHAAHIQPVKGNRSCLVSSLCKIRQTRSNMPRRYVLICTKFISRKGHYTRPPQVSVPRFSPVIYLIFEVYYGVQKKTQVNVSKVRLDINVRQSFVIRKNDIARLDTTNVLTFHI